MAIRESDWEDEEELVTALAELGLTRNEARLYLAAHGQAALRAAELAEQAGVTRTKAYDALRQLVDKGLFTEEPGKVARFRAVDPKLVVQRLRRQLVLEQASLVEDTGRLVADLFARYYSAPHGDDPFDFVELVRNAEAASARREALAAGARVEVVRARRLAPSGIDPPTADELGLRPGVRYRSLYERGFLDDEEFRSRLAGRAGWAEEVRFVDRLTVGVCVVDRRASVVSLNQSGVLSGPGTWVVLEHPGVSSLLADAFDILWADARPTDEPGEGQQNYGGN
jgi:predicted DNA-binding transcriptional regulator